MKGKGTREEIQQYGTIGQSKGFGMLGTNHLFNNVWRKSNWLLWWKTFVS
jgi:hypothetical protein